MLVICSGLQKHDNLGDCTKKVQDSYTFMEISIEEHPNLDKNLSISLRYPKSVNLLYTCSGLSQFEITQTGTVFTLKGTRFTLRSANFTLKGTDFTLKGTRFTL